MRVVKTKYDDPSLVLLVVSFHFYSPYAFPIKLAAVSPTPRIMTPQRLMARLDWSNGPPLVKTKKKRYGIAHPKSSPTCVITSLV